MQTTYRPGQWYVLVRPGAVVALPPDVADDVVARLWERMPERETLAAVVDVLSASVNGVFAALPAFAAAVAEGEDIRIALRGDVSARVSTATGSQEFSGVDVTTWNERFVLGASRVEITVEAAGADPEAAALPLHGGVVRAAAVNAELEPGAEPAAGGDPVVEPVPVPVVSEHTMSSSETTLASSTEDIEHRWDETVHSVPAIVPADASGPDASSPEPPASDAQAPVEDDLGDHDGATISVAQLRALRHQTPLPVDAPTADAMGVTGRIRVSTGQVVTLDRTVIIGRRPRSTRASGANLPHLIAVDSPQQDISRSHLEIRPEGDTVVVIDLHTTNGSTLLRPGADPMRLHPGEQTLVLSGDVVDLGDGVEVAFEDLP
jgi:hypothetical protein